MKRKLDVALALITALVSLALFLFARGWGLTPATLVGAAIGLLTYYLLGTIHRLGRMYRKE